MATATAAMGNPESPLLPPTASGGPTGQLPPDRLTGLSQAEAGRRLAAGRVNVAPRRERSDWEIIRQNTLTFFNAILGSLIAGLLIVGVVEREPSYFRDGLFVGLVVAANVAVATIQEIRATHMLRSLSALAAPRANVVRDGVEHSLPAEAVVLGDLIHLKRGDQVVADGTIVAGEADVDESVLTGESEPVLKRPGEELRSGIFCTGGECFYEAQHVGAESYAERLTADARKLVKRLTPLQLRFRRILRVFLFLTMGLAVTLMISYNVESRGLGESLTATTATITSVVPEGLLLAMTVAFTVGAVRVSRTGAVVHDASAVEALNYVDVICMDKTGTITANQLTLEDTRWMLGAAALAPWLAAYAINARSESNTAAALAAAIGEQTNGAVAVGAVPFNSQRRWSAMRLEHAGESRVFVLGAPEALIGDAPSEQLLREEYAAAAATGLRGLIFAEADELPLTDTALGPVRPLALILFADVLRSDVAEAFRMMEELGIEPKLISGDSPQTVAALVARLGVPVRGRPISGDELAGLDEEDFRTAVETTTVFGRIGPAEKLASYRRFGRSTSWRWWVMAQTTFRHCGRQT